LDEKGGESRKKYLLIDSPSSVFDQFYYHYLNTIYTVVGKRGSECSRVLVAESQFVNDCLNALIGVQSTCFLFNKNQVLVFFNERVSDEKKLKTVFFKKTLTDMA
jgi:hypothetical protein